MMSISKTNALQPDLVTFHIRAMRYGSHDRSREYDSLDRALYHARLDHDYGESARQEIWCGDECVYDHDQFMDWMVESRDDDDY